MDEWMKRNAKDKVIQLSKNEQNRERTNKTAEIKKGKNIKTKLKSSQNQKKKAEFSLKQISKT